MCIRDRSGAASRATGLRPGYLVAGDRHAGDALAATGLTPLWKFPIIIVSGRQAGFWVVESLEPRRGEPPPGLFAFRKHDGTPRPSQGLHGQGLRQPAPQAPESRPVGVPRLDL